MFLMELSEVTLCCCLTDSQRIIKKRERERAVIQAFELKAFWENLPFIVKVVFDLEIKSKAGKEFTNEEKKKLGIGLTGSGLGNASGKLQQSRCKVLYFPTAEKSIPWIL